MAEARVKDSWSSNVQCRYFLHGMCQRGENCLYSHDLAARPNNVCRYYLQGSCTYGKQCRYDHERPNKPALVKAQAPKPGSSAVPKPLVTSINGNLNEPGRKMVTLKKHSAPETLAPDSSVTKLPNPDDWVKAAVFVPGQLWKGSEPVSYVEAARSGVESLDLACRENEYEESEYYKGLTDAEKSKELCPFALNGECRYGENCVYMHGNFCDYCGRAALHPTDNKLRDKHTNECIKQHERDMELSFAIARSSNKTCGICMEVVMEKINSTEQRFGLLSNCNHVFCLSCIRKWRAAKQFENKIVRSCPECRVKSDFVTPSKYWVEERSEKEHLIEGYKEALKNKPCKYFDQGRGECPFNNNCFYLHAYPDGRKASPKPVRRRPRQNADGQLDFVQQIILWDYLEEHRRRLTMEFDLEDSLEELLMSAGLWDTDSDDSDFSDYS